MVILGSITLDREPASVGMGRRYVRGLLEVEGVQADGIVLLVSELLTNAVDHGGGGRMGLLVTGTEERIRVEVADGGGSGRTPRVHHPGVEDERGRGLLLVAAESDEWGVRKAANGTTVWAEIPRKPAE